MNGNSMMCPLKNIEDAPEFILDYAARRLDAQKLALFEKHMRVCLDCAALAVEQTAVWEALDSWQAAPVSAGFNHTLWQRIDALDAALDAAPWYQRLAGSLRFANWKPAFPLAVAVLLIAAGFVLDQRSARPVAPAVTVMEAEQVAQTLDDIQLLHQFNASTRM
jgi:hypothetical protein